MPKDLYFFLSRREAQIMDVIYRLGQASVSDVVESVADPPGYNSIRVLLTILEKKGYLTHKKEGQKYIYTPTEVAEKTKQSAMKHMLSTFFHGSTPNVVSTLLDISTARLTEEELNEIAVMIEKAKAEKNK